MLLTMTRPRGRHRPVPTIAMARKRKGRPLNGWLVLDKPADMTSTEAVSKTRRLLNAAKAGHAGTLDPMATGILPIAFGEATKTVSHAMDGEKTYRFTVHWGIETDTDDAEGTKTNSSPVRPDRPAIDKVLPRFIGLVSQVPPRYSAIKVGGERAYDLAREGEEPVLNARDVQIHDIRVVDMPDTDHAIMDVECGKGTYMRALARDMARSLGTLGHLSALRRTRVGPFSLDVAVTLDHLERLVADGTADRVLLPVEAPLDDIPAVDLTETEAHQMRRGQPVALLRRSDRDRLATLRQDETGGVVLTTSAGVPVALARLDGVALKPVRVLNL